jgi:superfamily II DNA or RNA helicase
MTDISLGEREREVLSGLKDFQRATVQRCFDLLTSGQRRVLVADEVGLGKTLIARGVIAKLANFHKRSDNRLFKVLYICSNASIANQNIRKLKIHDNVAVDGVSDTRLSM